VAVDKFSKWVEAKPIRTLDAATTTKFLWELILRYGYPHNIIIDNGSNFKKIFARFSHDKGIRLDLTSVTNPESNGQAERTNQMILRGSKPLLQVPLERAIGAWIDELPSVLWSIRTMANRSMGYTPFFLVYGAKAILPTNIEADNESAMQVTKDLLEEE